jgi:SEL1 protein
LQLLRYMYEHGLGLRTKDLHLAKRYYDMALDTSAEAAAPIRLAVWALQVLTALSTVWAASCDKL